MITFALYNLKGGVGKTASAINLAYLAAADEFKTLVWDLDPQGSSSFYLKAREQKNISQQLFTDDLLPTDVIQSTEFEKLFILPADISARNSDLLLSELRRSRRKLASMITSVKRDYDVLFLDCPPGISLLHENIFAAADWILIANIPTTLSIRSFETVKQYFEENELDTKKIKCFFSMVDIRKNLHHDVMHEFYRDKLFFKNYIPYLSDVEKMGTHQNPIFEFANSSYAAQCFRDLWREIKRECFE
jgi:cellulose biosynthesis protein BcsQ